MTLSIPRTWRMAVVLALIGLLAVPLWTFAADADVPDSAPPPAEATAAEAKPLRPWIAGLAEGRRRALADRKPILLRATAEWCPPCRALDTEIGADAVQAALADWTLVEVDVDRAADDARQLGITALPTLRILTAAGRPVAEHLGRLDAEELVAWLTEHRQAARESPDDALLAAGKPNLMAAVKLAAAFGHRDPAVRLAAVGRLQPYPDVGAAVTLRALGEGSLAERLTALELLDAWGAPVGDVDPWKPETIDADRLARLETWFDEHAQPAASASEPAAPKELSAEQRAAAGVEIDRMLRGTDAEAAAARDRLARFGPALAEEVDRRLAEAATDRDRERLAALRLRLAASDALALRWPGGIERLAATDSATRRQAAEQLASLATAADQALLLRLFADPDPLVRETGLQGLQRVGGPEAVGTLAELLSDPEPNVRAAVLKLLEEDPLPAMVPRIVEYVKTETDPDLLVHALRFLRASGGAAAMRAMMGLVEHPSWQVRAEAAAGLGNVETSFRRVAGGSYYRADTSDAMQAEAYAALIRLLADPDAFVVSRAVEGLARADMAVAVEPLVEAAAAHPELATSIVALLARGDQMRPKAVPHLRRFARHDDAVIRAAAVVGLVQAVPDAAEKELAAALDDAESEVRTAAAVALLSMMEATRRDAASRIERQQQEARALAFIDPFDVPTTSPSLLGRLGGALGRMFGGGTPPPAMEMEIVPEPGGPPTTLLPDGEDPPHADPPALGPPDGDLVPAPPAETPDAEPDASAPDLPDPGVEWDRWLEDYYAGKRRPAFAAELVEPLRKMLTADEPGERLAAALVLVPLGLADEALPVVLDTARDERALRGDAAAVLPWLVWQRRKEAFEQLQELIDDDDAWRLMRNLLPVADRRAAELLWNLLADAEQGGAFVGVVYSHLETIYLGSRFWGSAADIAPSARAEALRAAKPRVGEGSDWQRAAALALLLRVAPSEAAAAAEPLADDPSASERLRDLAFQVLLAAQSEPERHAAAIDALGSDNRFRKSLAVAYLAEGKNQLEYFRFDGGGWRNWLNLAVVGDETSDPFGHFGSSRPTEPKLPPELRPEHLRPLLDQADPALAAQAGYLLVLLGEASGLEPLLHQWRLLDAPVDEFALPRDRRSFTRLVYRAIAALDDSSRIDVLREIYGTLDPYSVRDFYWTIRAMTGPEMLQFRKEIRDEVGMEQLR